MRTSNQVDRQLGQARTLYNEGKLLFHNKSYEEASALFEAAIEIQEVTLGKYHQDTIKSYWRCGRASCMAGKNNAALRAFQRAARMSASTFDERLNRQLWEEIKACWTENHGAADNSINQLGVIFQLEQQGDAATKKKSFSKAAEFYQKAMAIQAGLVGDDSLDGADLRCKLSCCYLKLSKLEEADAVLNVAHECYMKHFGEQHPATLGAVASLKTVRDRGLQDGMRKQKSWFSNSSLSLGNSRHSTAQA